MAAAPFARTVAPMDLADVLELWKKDIMLNLNCHHIGTIQGFNSSKQTVSASVNYSKTYYEKTTGNQYQPVQVDYPLLVDCPVIILGGGTSALTFPITVGDQCLVLFNDRDIDNWVKGSFSGPVSTNRAHSFSDGIVLVGLNKISAYDAVRALISNGHVKVGINPTTNKALIGNDVTTLNTLLAQLITTIKAITTSNAVVGSPCTISPASQASLDTVANSIAGLLE